MAMDSEEFLIFQELQDYICPITLEIMKEPVCTEDGHSYEKQAITKWFNGEHFSSPATGQHLESIKLIPNHRLKAAIERFTQNKKNQFLLGKMYANDRGVEQDSEQAISWMERAAKHGHIEAQFELGKMYTQSQGVDRDEKKACEWYELAAKQGHITAQYWLGVRYEAGRGVDKNDRKAFEWYEAAAKRGYAQAQFNLGLMYENGRGVDEDDEQAFKWYEAA